MGSGHVRVIPQLDGNILRVYYGDSIVELSQILEKSSIKNHETISNGSKEMWMSFVSPQTGLAVETEIQARKSGKLKVKPSM